jgi:hypothetical protein
MAQKYGTGHGWAINRQVTGSAAALQGQCRDRQATGSGVGGPSVSGSLPLVRSARVDGWTIASRPGS